MSQCCIVSCHWSVMTQCRGLLWRSVLSWVVCDDTMLCFVMAQCRIMRDLSRVGASGMGKSRGYAFINFTDHTDALHALRATNNKPEIFGDKKVQRFCMLWLSFMPSIYHMLILYYSWTDNNIFGSHILMPWFLPFSQKFAMFFFAIFCHDFLLSLAVSDVASNCWVLVGKSTNSAGQREACWAGEGMS